MDNLSQTWAQFSDPLAAGWSYQSFGVWTTYQGAVSGVAAGYQGVVSVGIPTAAGSIPSSGSATFRGTLLGQYMYPTQRSTAWYVASDITLSASFADRRVSLTSGQIIHANDYNSLSDGYRISGDLSYAAGQNRLTGVLTTGNGLLSGAATAQFYGPSAQEIGGVFILTPKDSSSMEQFSGAFGAKQ